MFFRCKCERCNNKNLVGALEFRCCREVVNASAKMVFDRSIECIKCITQHEDYGALTLTDVDTCFGPCPVVSLGSHQLSLTESNFTFISSFDGFDDPVLCTESEFPSYSSFPLDDCCGLSQQ